MARQAQYTIVALGAFAIACLPFSATAIAAEKIPKFQTTQVKRVSITQSFQCYGTVDTQNKVLVRSKTLGTVTMLIKEGDIVKKDQLIATINNPKLQDTIVNNQNQYLLAKLDLESAKRKLTQGRKLYAISSISKDALLDLESGYQRSEISLENAKKSLEYAKEERQYARITAPFEGKVIGITTLSGSDVVAGTELLTLADMRQLTVQLTVPQSYIPKIKAGQKVRFEAGMLSRSVAGSILGISQKVEKADGAKQGVTVICRFSPENPYGILIGALVVGHIVISSKSNVAAVPVDAVWGNAMSGFYLLTQDSSRELTKVPVRLGISDQNYVEIDKNSLKNIALIPDAASFAAIAKLITPAEPQ